MLFTSVQLWIQHKIDLSPEKIQVSEGGIDEFGDHQVAVVIGEGGETAPLKVNLYPR